MSYSSSTLEFVQQQLQQDLPEDSLQVWLAVSLFLAGYYVIIGWIFRKINKGARGHDMLAHLSVAVIGVCCCYYRY